MFSYDLNLWKPIALEKRLNAPNQIMLLFYNKIYSFIIFQLRKQIEAVLYQGHHCQHLL